MLTEQLLIIEVFVRQEHEDIRVPLITLMDVKSLVLAHCKKKA